MTRRRRTLTVLAALGLAAGLAAAASTPIPVSPAAAEGFARLGDPCPTFSWSAVPGALGYELVVYELHGEESTTAAGEAVPLEPERLALWRRIPGGALSWTPSLDDCLSPGLRFAWMVRAESAGDEQEWSEARLFELEAAPSLEEVQAAVRLLRRFLDAGAASGGPPTGHSEPAESRPASPKAARHRAEERQRALTASTAPLTLAGTAAIRGAQSATTGETYGLLGISSSGGDGSSGVVGEATAASGATRGVVGQVHSGDGTAGLFDNTAGGTILSGLANGTEVFSVAGDGAVSAAGSVSALGFFGDGSGLTNVATSWSDLSGIPAGFADGTDDVSVYTAGNQLTLADGSFNVVEGPGSDLDADTLDGQQASAFASAAHDHFAAAWIGAVNGGPGLTLINSSDTAASSALSAAATGTSSSTVGIRGTSSSPTGVGIVGQATATSGSAVGVSGATSSPDGVGVLGNAAATSGAGTGVRGVSPSSLGKGVVGLATASTGTTGGVEGFSLSTEGHGVLGKASAVSGINYGVIGLNHSTDGIGVQGSALASSGANVGVRGLTSSTDGRGLSGWASALSGSTIGTEGRVESPDGIAGVFDNTATGRILSGRANGSEVFSVDTDGTVRASSFVGDGSSLTNVATGWNAISGIPDGFADGTDDDTTYVAGNHLFLQGNFFHVQDGPASGLDADTLDGEEASAFAAAGHDHLLQTWSLSAGGSLLTLINAGQNNSMGLHAIATGTNTPTRGVLGESHSSSGTGVHGKATSPSGTATGVRGESSSSSGMGVLGEALSSSGTTYGVLGFNHSTSGIGVIGQAVASTGTNYGVYGSTNSPSGYAGYFQGRTHVTSDLSVGGILSKGGGSFKIDHPLEPDRKYLSHSFVESPDMMNLYNGNVTLDENGEAWVELPEWFEALNRDFRYQLTPVGQYAPLWIGEPIANNRFKISSSVASVQVSWQVTGIRHDPWAETHRIPVEEDKPPAEVGTYLHPDAIGMPVELGLHHRHTVSH